MLDARASAGKAVSRATEARAPAMEGDPHDERRDQEHERGEPALERGGASMTPPCPDGLDQVFLYGARRLLLLLHAAGSIVLLGSSTHHALQMRHYLRGRFDREKLEKLYAKVVAVSYLFTFVMGALLYPTYRVHVRALYLDRYAPGYAGLFDMKEFYASLALLVAMGLGALAFTLRPAEQPWLARVYAAMSALVVAVVWFNVISGILITSVRGIG